MFEKKRRSLHPVAALLALVLVTSSPAGAASNWADAPADLTVGEYLELLFRLDMERPEGEALNAYSLVAFYPSTDPQTAFVLVIQTWRDERLQPQDLRREVRKDGQALTYQFESKARLPFVTKRWRMVNPKAHIVVRHVRYSDLGETLAVTRDGETFFDEGEILSAKDEVIARGGIWSW